MCVCGVVTSIIHVPNRWFSANWHRPQHTTIKVRLYMCVRDRKCVAPRRARVSYFFRLFITGILIGFALHATAQGDKGIDAATKQVHEYFDNGVNLLYAIGGFVGLVGAVKVYNKWSSGDQDTGRVAASWFGACIFLIVVAAVLRGFFNIPA